MQESKLQVTIDEIFGINQATQGQMYLKSGLSKGKILYKIS
jgi:hypothetical protein